MALSPVEGGWREASPQARQPFALSGLSQVLLRQGWSEVHFAAQSSRLAFRRDDSLALMVQTSTSFTARRQETLLEICSPPRF